MPKQTIAAALFTAAIAIGFSGHAQAGDIVLSTAAYDSPQGYDFISTFPPAGSTTIGSYTFSPIPVVDVLGISISGTFGNGDVSVTALSDYYLGDSTGDGETAVEAAGGNLANYPCNDVSDDCYSGSGPTPWTLTLDPAQIGDLAAGLANGSLDFTYTWENNTEVAIQGYDQYVYAGPATIDISLTPEPATFLICFSGIAGIVVLRRRRKI